MSQARRRSRPCGVRRRSRSNLADGGLQGLGRAQRGEEVKHARRLITSFSGCLHYYVAEVRSPGRLYNQRASFMRETPKDFFFLRVLGKIEE